jgi:hypothetical protein
VEEVIILSWTLWRGELFFMLTPYQCCFLLYPVSWYFESDLVDLSLLHVLYHYFPYFVLPCILDRSSQGLLVQLSETLLVHCLLIVLRETYALDIDCGLPFVLLCLSILVIISLCL